MLADIWAFSEDRLRAVIQDVAAQPAHGQLAQVLEMVIRTRIIVIGLQSSVLLDTAHRGPDPVLNVQQLNKAISLALSLYDTLRSRSSETGAEESFGASEEEVWRYFLLLGLENEPRHGAERFNDFLCKCPRWV